MKSLIEEAAVPGDGDEFHSKGKNGKELPSGPVVSPSRRGSVVSAPALALSLLGNPDLKSELCEAGGGCETSRLPL